MRDLASVSGFFDSSVTKPVESKPSQKNSEWGYALKISSSVHKYDPEIINGLLVAQVKHIFEDLNQALLRETWFMSSESDITSNDNYKRIVGLGEPALHFILCEMQRGRVEHQWFPLLYDLSGTNPVPPAARGIVDEMTASWLRWGQANSKI